MGSDLIIPNMEYASLEMVEMTLNWFLPPKGCSAVILFKALPGCQGHGYQLNESTIGFGLENVLVVRLGQGPMLNGLEALCRIYSMHLFNPCNNHEGLSQSHVNNCQPNTTSQYGFFVLSES